jgi:hypothetical protein
MIRVRKPEAPAVLNERGLPATLALCEEYDHSPEVYQRPLFFDRDIYAHTAVVEALAAGQHRKC